MNSTPQEMTDRAAFEFGLFGQPEFKLNGTVLNLSIKKLLGLIAYLTIEGSGSRSVLAGLFWTELDEASARRNLRQRLYRLSPPELSACILIEANCVSMVGNVSSDVARFELAIQESRFGEAVELYRGTLLDGLELEEASAFHEWLEIKRETFDRAYQRALAGLAEQFEASSAIREALASHLRLIALNPLLELHQRHVMRLRALLGERIEALAGFEVFRSLLETELGLLPTPQTLQMVAQIRQQGAFEQDVSRVASVQGLPSDTAQMIGRASVMRQLETARNAGKMVFVSGEPGIGKSRLLSEFGKGKTTLVIPGRVGDATIPFATLTRLLRKLLLANPKINMPRWIRKELSRLIPSLDEPLPPGEPEARITLFDAFAEFLWLTTQTVDTYLVDDLQFFDLDSFAMLMHMFARPDYPSHKHQVLAYRTAELSQAMTSSLEHVQNAVWLQLEPLNENSVRDLIKNLLGAQEFNLLSSQLHRATGGNPFFALETLKSLVESRSLQQNEHGVWSTASDFHDAAELPMPESVIAAVKERVSRLGIETTRLLETASLAGDSFSLEDLQSATTLTEFEALDGFERALELRLLERQTSGYRFSHDLVREALALGLGAERRRLLHRKLAESFEKHGAPAARIAEHLELAGQALAAAPWRVKAAKAALLVYANLEATAQYEKALQNDPEANLGRAEILDVLVVLLWRQDKLEQALTWAQEVATIRALFTDEKGLARAEIRIGVIEMSLGHSELARTVLERALGRARAVNALQEQAMSLINLAKLHTDSGDVLAAKPVIEAGLALGEALAADERAMLEMARTYCALLEGDLGLAVKLVSVSILSAESSSSPLAHCSAMLLAVQVFLCIGEVATAQNLLNDIGVLIERHSFGFQHAERIINCAWLELERKNPKLALETISGLVQTDVNQPEDQASIAWMMALAQLHLHEPQAALETLASLENAQTLEVWTRILAVRLQAALETGANLEGYIKAAQTQLESNRTPALERLELRRALANALEHAQPEAAMTMRQTANTQRLEMAQTLEGQPEIRACFLEKYPELKT